MLKHNLKTVLLSLVVCNSLVIIARTIGSIDASFFIGGLALYSIIFIRDIFGNK